MAFFLAACLASLLAGAASKSVVRQQESTRQVRMHLGASGDMVEELDDICDQDFILGKPDSNDCSQGHHNPVHSSEDCVVAARKAGVKTIHGFRLKDGTPITLSDGNTVPQQDHEQLRPEGCFKMSCKNGDGTNPDPADTTDEECYWFNPKMSDSGYNPNATTIKGTPVCSRQKYLIGTIDSSTCATDYHLEMNQAKCMEAGNCLAIQEAPENFVANQGNASKYNDYPKGCFIMTKDLMGADDDRVYFNKPIKDAVSGKEVSLQTGQEVTDTKDNMPLHPVGRPICTIENEGGVNTHGVAR